MEKYITFFIDGDQEAFDEIEKLILLPTYSISFWLISHEEFNSKNEKKPHYHFILKCTEKAYNALFKRLKIFLGAKCDSTKGGYRPYGRLKVPIRDITKLKQYCSKDGNVRSSLPNKELKQLYEASYKKQDKEVFTNELCDWVAKNSYHPIYPCTNEWRDITDRIRGGVIHFLLDKKHKITRPTVESYFLTFIRSDYCPLSPEKKKTFLFNHFYG